MAIKVFHPKVEVILLKNVANDKGMSTRYEGNRGRIDLTPWIGDAGEVVTRDSVNGPANVFSITLADRMDKATMDSLYTSIAPMDGVEIRMTGEPHAHQGSIPITMRGLITQIRRTEVMGEDGRPVRAVVISGRDFGKVFSDVQIFYWAFYATGQNLISGFEFAKLTGLDQTSLPVSDFMRVILDKFINPYLQRMFRIRDREKNDSAPQIRFFGLELPGTVSLHGIQMDHRSMWQLMTYFADLSWNELFVFDDEDGPVLMFRAKPYKSYGEGQFIIPEGFFVAEVGVDHRDIKSFEASRGDQDVANLFWVDNPPLFWLKSTDFRPYELGKSDGTVYIQDYPNNNPNLYGDRVMQTMSPLSGYGWKESNLPEKELGDAQDQLSSWARRRRVELFELNKDNSVFESGQITLRGNYRLHAGNYLVVDRGGLKFECYAHTVTHKFLPFRTYTTTADFIRGTSYRDRSRMSGSPYFSEIGKGAYGPVSNR